MRGILSLSLSLESFVSDRPRCGSQRLYDQVADTMRPTDGGSHIVLFIVIKCAIIRHPSRKVRARSLKQCDGADGRDASRTIPHQRRGARAATLALVGVLAS